MDVPLFARKAFIEEKSYLPHFLGGGSGYFQFPAIPPYHFRTVHFVEHRLLEWQYVM